MQTALKHTRLNYTRVHILPTSPACTVGIFVYWNVGHHFKLTICMHIAQFKTINQVLDYLLALIVYLITNTVNNFRLDSSGWHGEGKKTIGGSKLVNKLFTFVMLCPYSPSIRILK